MLVIIPGWMHNASQWNAVSSLLTQQNIDHAVLDIPGFGAVTADHSIATLDDLSLWCLARINELQEKSQTPLVLFGHSCGGRVAVQLVSEGLSVDTMILSGSPNLYRPTAKVRAIKALAALFGPIRSLIPRRIRLRLRSDDYTNAKGTDMQKLYSAVVLGDQGNLLSSVACKTILLWGEDDTAAPISIAHEMQTLITSSTLEVIPGAGHNLHQEKSALLAAKISSYVTAS